MRTLFKKGWLFIIAIILIALFSWGDARRMGVSFFMLIQKPFSASAEYISNTSAYIWSYVQSKDRLTEERDALTAEIERLRTELALTEDIRSDYDSLLKAIDESPDEGTIARVLPNPSSHTFGIITVNKGSEDGIQTNMKALLHGTILVGFVEEVSAHSARVRLLSSFNTETQLKLGDTQSTILATGRGDGLLQITLPRDFPVIPGDRLLYIDSAPFLAAIVDTVKEPGAESTRKIQATTPFNPRTISLVALVP
ncbi:MAG: hypothetical protein COU47_00090 [Candidatus Niyogibacteria bacterium CG10_big_fil_rev_8_21_14_0_10_46_36]|uniref:Rod shape-determining protein MreC beta-barrel core domain-containing protein n=1 Tax=Candidatus Niyogibacteria bacterium CG10_big_fil_rev_8_21_14_0_10_46_36 TaxID=1974726 RepID=A0A2H0TE55_9BACT|nr:MAG: hypothetical protein COU47_00090 [Candidatus Niyogibacteria bacterium CG10_big_fil_rev_8_21_14_0_10_46_36]